jgi:two-component system chemotaxis sensor kinase CheA
MMGDDEFLEELRREFLAEAASLLDNWEEHFLKLEEADDKNEQLTNIFRVAHSIKGTSSAVGYSDMAEFAHIVEDLLSCLTKAPQSLTAEIVSLLLQCGDAFKHKVAFLSGQDQKDWHVEELSLQIHHKLEQFGKSHAKKTPPKQEQLVSDHQGDIGDDAAWKQLLEDVKNEMGITLSEEELKSLHPQNQESARENKPVVSEQVARPQAMVPEEKVEIEKKTSQTSAVVASKSATVKVDAHKIDKIMNLIGELVINKSQLANRVEKYKDDHLMESTYSLLEKTIRELQDETLGIRMISLKNLFLKCQRAVRDVSLKLGKNIELVQFGEDVEIDRSMVENLTDPLLHMLRNAVDHGIESDQERTANGKKPGRILLAAENVGSKIVIQIQDDGRGIDPEKVFKKAKANGLVGPTVEITDLTQNEIFHFIMMPGFSTAEKITDVSGRGVGLDVVKTSIEKMSGKIEIDSRPGHGTRFRLILPLTTSILEGLHVKSSNSSLIFPTEKVHEIISGDKLQFVKDSSGLMMFRFRNKILPYAPLDTCLGKSHSIHPTKMVLILDLDGKLFGVGIDEFIAQVHVVLKPISDIVKTSTGISASCILSHGGIGFVIDTEEVGKLLLKLQNTGLEVA